MFKIWIVYRIDSILYTTDGFVGLDWCFKSCMNGRTLGEHSFPLNHKNFPILQEFSRNSPGISMDFPWMSWEFPLHFHGFPWISLEFRLIALDFPGLPLNFHVISQELSGNFLGIISLEFPRISLLFPWTFLGFPRNFHGFLRISRISLDVLGIS